jgi:hypothetical protein
METPRPTYIQSSCVFESSTANLVFYSGQLTTRYEDSIGRCHFNTGGRLLNTDDYADGCIKAAIQAYALENIVNDRYSAWITYEADADNTWAELLTITDKDGVLNSLTTSEGVDVKDNHDSICIVQVVAVSTIRLPKHFSLFKSF